MTPLPAPALLDALRWRYATKAFDPARPIPAELWDALEETLVLTPSSFGLQPWHFLVLTDRALRETLVPHAWGQRQVADCSHFIVMAIRKGVGTAEIDALLARVAEVRGTPATQLAGYRKMMVGSLVEGPGAAAIDEWAARQAYIALGSFMTAAAVLGVDTCPMEGFEPAKFDEILGLPSCGLASVVCCAAGYRSPSDKYAALPKVRFPRAQVVERR